MMYTGLACTSKMVQHRVVENSNWSFQKVFGDGEFIAAGQVVIPPGERKQRKGTKDNTYVRIFLFCLSLRRANWRVDRYSMSSMVLRILKYIIQLLCSQPALCSLFHVVSLSISCINSNFTICHGHSRQLIFHRKHHQSRRQIFLHTGAASPRRHGKYSYAHRRPETKPSRWYFSKLGFLARFDEYLS